MSGFGGFLILYEWGLWIGVGVIVLGFLLVEVVLGGCNF